MATKILLIVCKVCHNSFTANIGVNNLTKDHPELVRLLKHFIPVHDDCTGEEYYVCQACGCSVPMED